MAFQEVNTDGGNKFKFEEVGQVLEGHYLGDDTINIKGKEVLRHSFNINGEITSTLGSYQLNEILEKVSPGQLVRLTYKGKKSTGKGNTVKTFKLEVDTSNTIPVAKAVNSTEAAIASMRGE
jgi:hypothetical protein